VAIFRLAGVLAGDVRRGSTDGAARFLRPSVQCSSPVAATASGWTVRCGWYYSRLWPGAVPSPNRKNRQLKRRYLLLVYGPVSLRRPTSGTGTRPTADGWSGSGPRRGAPSREPTRRRPIPGIRQCRPRHQRPFHVASIRRGVPVTLSPFASVRHENCRAVAAPPISRYRRGPSATVEPRPVRTLCGRSPPNTYLTRKND